MLAERFSPLTALLFVYVALPAVCCEYYQPFLPSMTSSGLITFYCCLSAAPALLLLKSPKSALPGLYFY